MVTNLVSTDPVKNNAEKPAAQTPPPLPPAAAPPGTTPGRKLLKVILVLALLCIVGAGAWSLAFSHQVSTDGRASG